MSKIRNVKRQKLYDSWRIEDAVARDYEFFKIPIGGVEQVGVNSKSKTKFDTNNDVAGQIPNRSEMIIYGFNVGLWGPAVIAIEDVKAVLAQCQAFMRLTIRDVEYYVTPLFTVPSGYGLVVNNATGNAVDFNSWTNGEANKKNIESLEPKPIRIPALTPYSLNIRFEKAPDITADTEMRIFVFMDGIIREPVYK